MQTDVLELNGIRERLQEAENSSDSDYIGRMMADDAVIMVPNLPVHEGKAACAGFVRDILAGLLWTILLPGFLAGYVPWRYFGLGRARFSASSPTHVLGIFCIGVGAMLS